MGTTKKRKSKTSKIHRSERQATLMLEGQKNWIKQTGIYFPVEIGKLGVPRR